jgi:enoyl-CoA hydratase/carnithine racemase
VSDGDHPTTLVTSRPAPQSFRLEIERGIATLTLDRPERLNALTFDAFRELRDVFRSLGQEPVGPAARERAGEGELVRAVIMTGTGAGFCSGGDIDEVIGRLTSMGGAELLAFARLAGEVVLAVRRLHKPVIAAVNGVAVGAGAALALAADIRIASALARFGFSFSRVGLSGAEMGCTWLLPRIVGLGRASEILLTGDIIDAFTAERYGLVSKVVPAENLLRTATEMAIKLAAGPTFAHGMTKEMLDREAHLDLEAALAAEAQAQQICVQSHDFREAYRALTRKRRPRFQGR